MGIFNFLKKEREPAAGEELEIPPAPPIREALPSFSEKDVRAIKEAVGKPRPRAEVAEPHKKIAEIEEGAVAAQRRLLGRREHLELTKPIFVDLPVFKNIIDEIALIQNTIKESRDSLSRLDEFKEDEDKEFKRWQNIVQDAQKKLIYVDKTLFG
jgi:hypothetical protein